MRDVELAAGIVAFLVESSQIPSTDYFLVYPR